MNQYILDYKKEAIRRIKNFQERYGRHPAGGDSVDWLHLHTLLEQEGIEGWQYMRGLKALCKEIEAGRVDEKSVDLTASVKAIAPSFRSKTKVSPMELSPDLMSFAHEKARAAAKPAVKADIPEKPVLKAKSQLPKTEPMKFVTPVFAERVTPALVPVTGGRILKVHSEWAVGAVEIRVPEGEDISSYLASRKMTLAEEPAQIMAVQAPEPVLI